MNASFDQSIFSCFSWQKLAKFIFKMAKNNMYVFGFSSTQIWRNAFERIARFVLLGSSLVAKNWKDSFKHIYIHGWSIVKFG